MNSIELKDLAKRQLGGDLGIFVIFYLIAFGLFLLTRGISSTIAYLLGILLEFSMISIYMRLSDGITPDVKSIFDIFKNINLCGNCLILYMLISIFTTLWSLLLIVPGIIKALSYAMAPYILMENEYYMSPMDAIKESQRIMEGHKMELFVLMLSFIGWYVLGVFTCGLVLFYAEPYFGMTMVNFYNKIKDDSEII